MEKMSVVIPTEGDLCWKNGSILYTLMALKNQLHVDLDVSVVTSSVTDDFEHRMNELGVKTIVSECVCAGERRNLGAKHAKSNKILFVDDDTVIIDRDTVIKASRALDSNDYTCGAFRYWSSFYWYKHVTPLLDIGTNMTVLRNISILPRGINRVYGFRDLNEFTFIGNFGALRANVFFDIGGFCDDFRVYGYEDVDLMMRLCMGGHSSELLCEASSGVIHLTHPMKTDEHLSNNGLIFDKLQKQRGYYFQVNHFFGVYEGDGHAILTPCERLQDALEVG